MKAFLEASRDVGERLSTLVERMHEKGATTEADYAGVIGQLNDETIIAFLAFMKDQKNFRLCKRQEHQITLSPFKVLAHLKDVEKRDLLFQSLGYNELLDVLAPSGATLINYPAADRIGYFQNNDAFIGRIDAKVYAMFFDQIEDMVLQEALLNEFDTSKNSHFDHNRKQITKQTIEAAMKKNWKPESVSVSITKEDGMVAALAGGGALAVTAAAITVMIFTSRLWFATWGNFPTYRGVYPTALMATLGFGAGKLATGSDGVGAIAAFILGTFASPRVSKLISSHKMTFWHGAGFSLVSMLGLLIMNLEND